MKKLIALVLAAAAPVIFEAADPDNDDHGPGNYRYPTASDFHDGAFDIEPADDASDGESE